jgi:N-methylhydantoinase A/oxoprolinase/acetone carboxylase beta subunit
VESVAVAFFNSCASPAHEAQAAAILRDEAPALTVCHLLRRQHQYHRPWLDDDQQMAGHGG